MSVMIGRRLSIEDVVAVANGAQRVDVSAGVAPLMEKTREVVRRHLDDDNPHYGVNTGFGALAEVRISHDDLARLQLNLIRSHASGVGDPMPTPVVRAAMLLRASVLATGLSGVRIDLVHQLAAMLNARIHPLVPSRGSVGASGDLAPLAHVALAMIGEGDCDVEGRNMPAAEALKSAGLKPLVLEPKEGLSLVNGTQFMTAAGCLALFDAEHLTRAADIVGAMSLEAVLGTPEAFDAGIMEARPHPGQAASANLLRRVIEGSDIRESHRECAKVQDPYSLRCMPQVHGAVRDSLAHIRGVLDVEINSATDNPLVFDDGRIVSGGNFHGAPISIAMDLLAIAVSELGSISERRVEHLLNPALSQGLTPFLASRSGLCSGYMISQVAAASLVSENKVLAHPASVDSIPSSANREDHVSMGMTAALKARDVVKNTHTVLAIEAMCASAGLDQRLPKRPGMALRAAHEAIRAHVPPLDGDRKPSEDIKTLEGLLRPGGGIVETALAALE
ncbi:MAG: histidine ammonia-lyase [Deltaproteobacteria bacterium]|nr:histidine ammonia-lyase [Deltaproteobacteria bacterium]